MEVMERASKARGEKVYAGFYNYSRNENDYTEEIFQVFRDRHDLSLFFYADIIGRMVTGEMFKIHVDYKVNKEFMPLSVTVKKILGDRNTCEEYFYNKDKGNVRYSFTSSLEEKVHQKDIPTRSDFFIAVPASCTSFLFLKPKKESSSNENTYYTLRSFNQWTFNAYPSTHPIMVRRDGVNYKTITIGNKVPTQAIPYTVFDGDKDSETDSISIYTSKYVSIPYLILGPDGTKVQIIHFNNFDQEA